MYVWKWKQQCLTFYFYLNTFGLYSERDLKMFTCERIEKNFYSGLTVLLLFLLFKAFSKQTIKIILLLAIIRQKNLQVKEIYKS